jgi:hypothetical protein
MNRKLLTIVIALVIFAIVAAPVTARLQGKNPWPPSNPCYNVWALLQDLQNQLTAIGGTDTTQNAKIAALEARIATLEAAPHLTTYSATGYCDNEPIHVPIGFTKDQCQFSASIRKFEYIYDPAALDSFYSVIGGDDTSWTCYCTPHPLAPGTLPNNYCEANYVISCSK